MYSRVSWDTVHRHLVIGITVVL